MLKGAHPLENGSKLYAMYIYIYRVYPNTCNSQKEGFPHRDSPKRCTKQLVILGELVIGDLSGHGVCLYSSPARPSCSVSCFLVYSFVPFCVLQFVPFGVLLLRAILCGAVRAFWCTPSCRFVCSSSCFLVYSFFVPFCVVQFVLFGVLPLAILRAPVRAFWRAASCSWSCGLLQLQLFKNMKAAVYVFVFLWGSHPRNQPSCLLNT